PGRRNAGRASRKAVIVRLVGASARRQAGICFGRRRWYTASARTSRERYAMAASLPDRTAETEEVDIWWGSYAGRTMLPGFLVCLVVTIFLLALDGYLESRNQRSDLISSLLLSLAGA